ncbi:MAG: efflux RND transporter permease subunit [Acidobacteriota bacterium]|nr:efflux RND transporter permease subunit [Acidobacteriota bacterium]
MNISETFIRRPIATSLIMAAIALFGVISYRALPVSDLPQVDYPTITVSASLPGANPDTMASAVATPLERQFTTIAGLDSMISNSGQGSTSITLQFDLSRDIDGATVDVETAIAEAMPLLPPGMPTPPSFRKVNPGDAPIISLFVTSSTMRLSDLDEYAETILAQRISMVEGVAQVQVYGSAKYAVRVQVDPDALFHRQIGLNEIDQALRDWNVNVPTGTLYGPKKSYNVTANGQLMKAREYRPMIVAYRNGAPVRLGEVSHVIDSLEDDKNLSLIYGGEYGMGTRGVNLAVMRQPGSNTIEVTDAIKALVPTLQGQIPPSVKVSIRGDRSKNIREAFEDIQFTLAATLVLVIFVIFLFLRNVRATMIPAMALPFSVVGTFSVMYLLGFSMNNISMMALILSVGFVVDDAIVMLENIVRHIEHGERPLAAALTGSREIGFTIVSMTLSLAAVFIPILFMSGILGRLFREFAVTICTAILISGLVSVTLTPMLCSRFLGEIDKQKHGVFYRAMERVFDGMLHLYSVTLTWVLRHRPVMLAAFLGVLGLTGYLYVVVPKGFIPDTDNDNFFVNIEAAQGTSYYQMVKYLQAAAAIVVKDPDVDTFYASTGGSFFGPSGASGRMMINTRPRRQRASTINDIVNRLRPKLSVFPGLRVFVSIPQAIRVGGRMSKSAYDFTMYGPDTQQLYALAPQFERIMMKLPGLQEVSSDLQIRTPRVNIVLDRDRAAALNLNWNNVSNTLYDAFGPRLASTIYASTNQYRVLLELDPQYQQHADGLDQLYLKSDTDQMVPLNAVSKLVTDAGPQSIPHSGQLPSVTISFALRPGMSLGQATGEIEDAAKNFLPATITGTFQGTAKVFQDSMQNMGVLLIVAIAVVYIVLGMLYESYVHPLTILSGLPSAGFGALLTLLLFKIELSIYSFVGLIMLIGIVKKNAIMQIDFALEAERKEGKPPAEAIHEGCLIRFRPIMMTTMAALLGTLPIALGYGAGGESRKPLGMAVVGGLAFSQLMTLYLTPVVYTYMASFVERWSASKARRRKLAPAMQAGD